MKARKVDYVKYSYLEGIQLMQDEVTDVQLKHWLWFHKSQGVTQLQTQQSMAQYRKVLKEGESNFERNTIP